MIKERSKMLSLFTAHPKSINETYLEHLFFACPTGIKFIFAGIACFLHGIFPFIFQTTGSDLAKKMVADMNRRTSNL